MMGYEWTIKGDDDLKKAFGKADKIVGDSLFDAIDKVLWNIVGGAKTYAPVKTGTLRRSIHKEGPTRKGFFIEGVAGTNVVYAPYQEYGTRFFSGKFYMQQGLEQAKNQAPAILKDALADIVVELAK